MSKESNEHAEIAIQQMERADGYASDQMERRGTRRNEEGPEGTERLEGPDGTDRGQVERRDTRWNGEGPEGTERDLKKWRET